MEHYGKECVYDMASQSYDSRVTEVKKRLASKALGRKIEPLDDVFQLREEIFSYIADFDAQNRDIAQENTYKWIISL